MNSARPDPFKRGSGDSLTFVADAREAVANRLGDVDLDAMQLVLMLYRVTNAIVYDIESSVHRPAGWSWSAFRLCFTLWVDGPLPLHAVARRTGMSKPAVLSLARTLEKDGHLARGGDSPRARTLALTDVGRTQLEKVMREHNKREQRWAAGLSPDELQLASALLGRLIRTGSEPWVSTR